MTNFFRKINSRTKENQGFTLIEILIVVAIMAMITSIALTSLSTVRKKARDSKRMSDIRQINSAIQMYIHDNGHAPYVYPSGDINECSASNVGAGECSSISDYAVTGAPNLAGWNGLQSQLSPYIKKLPKDPCGINCYKPGNFFAYYYLPPASMYGQCQNHYYPDNCSLSEQEINNLYAIYSNRMESSSTYLNTISEQTPTFGFTSSNFGASF